MWWKNMMFGQIEGVFLVAVGCWVLVREMEGIYLGVGMYLAMMVDVEKWWFGV